MSDRSDYIRCVSGPLEAKLRASIKALESALQAAERERDEAREALDRYRHGALAAFDGLCEKCRGGHSISEEARARAILARSRSILTGGGQ